jgi:type IV fimbrial biogenesis protein FimT
MTATRRPRRPLRGLTLIEIVVALAVLAVLATLTLPSFGALLTRHRLAATAEGLALDLAEARFQAAQLGQPLYLNFRAGPDWCYAVARTPDCDCRTDHACQLKTVRAADVPGVALADAEDTRFDPAAVAHVGGHAEWRTADGGERLEVSLSGLGRARICTATGLRGYAAC